MFSSIFQIGHLLFLLAAALAAFLGGLIVGLIKGEGGTALLRGLEALLLAAIGCLLSQLFIAGVLAIGHGKDSWAVALGLGFFLVPGLIDYLWSFFSWLSVSSGTTRSLRRLRTCPNLMP